MPGDLRIHGNNLTPESYYAALSEAEDRIRALEQALLTRPDQPLTANPSQPNPPPSGSAQVSATFNTSNSTWTIQLAPPVGTPPNIVYNLESSTDPKFEINVTDYGKSSQHLFVGLPGAANLLWRALISADGVTFGLPSPATNVPAELQE